MTATPPTLEVLKHDFHIAQQTHNFYRQYSKFPYFVKYRINGMHYRIERPEILKSLLRNYPGKVMCLQNKVYMGNVNHKRRCVLLGQLKATVDYLKGQTNSRMKELENVGTLSHGDTYDCERSL